MAFKRKKVQLSKEHFSTFYFFLANRSFLDMNDTTIAPICFYGNGDFEMIISVL